MIFEYDYKYEREARFLKESGSTESWQSFMVLFEMKKRERERAKMKVWETEKKMEWDSLQWPEQRQTAKGIWQFP